MSENEFDVQRDRAEEDRENVVLTGEEIELPGEDSDASAIIGESSEPIHTGEIESVAIGGLTGRVPAAAPLKPTIEDKISTGELPVVTAPEGDLPVVSPTDEADAAPEETHEHADAEQEAPEQDSSEAVAADESANEGEAADGGEDTAEVSSDDSADAVSEEVADQQDEPAEDNASANEEPASEQTDEEDAPSKDAAPEAEQTDDVSDEAEPVDDPEPTLAPVMTPAQAAAAMDLNLDDATEKADEPAEADDSADEPATGEADAADAAEESAVGGAAAEHTLTSRRSMIFGDDDDAASPSIPALAPLEQDETASSDEAEDPFAQLDLPTEEASPFTEPTTQLPTQDTEASYSFEDQDAAEAARPRRRSLLGEGDEDSEAATLAAIASTAARGDKSGAPSSLDDELFSAAPEITEMPSRTGAHWLSFLLFLLLVPVGWYLAADAGARMTLADAAPMYTGVASILALGELLGAVLISAILFVTARRSSLGAWLMGLLTLVVGLPWVMAPGITAASALSALTALTNTGSLGANLSHHLQASGYSGRFALLGIALLGLAYVSHSARRTGRAEEALRISLETTNPAGAFYSKRARKKAAKEAARK